MIMRALGKTGMMVSEVGLGCEHLQGKPYETVAAVIDAALEAGINYMDTFMSEPEVRSNIGKALKGKRERVMLQGHIGAAWKDGQYVRTRELDMCRRFVEDYLERMQTDYIDVGMLHFIDEADDWKAVMEGDAMAYAQKLKRDGVIKAIGMSSHNPLTALEAVRSGLIEVLMFSINPAYDLLSETIPIDDMFKNETYKLDSLTLNPVRAQLYRECEARGVGITVMKSLGASALLHDAGSPFGSAFTVPQLINYSLTRPAVASVLVGAQTPDEVHAAAAYENATDAERDYAKVIMQTPKFTLAGHCMYCNHCLPCPSKIDIARVNKYLDLALAQADVPETVRAHYMELKQTARDCVACGQCETRCPFGVPVKARMQRAQELFGR